MGAPGFGRDLDGGSTSAALVTMNSEAQPARNEATIGARTVFGRAGQTSRRITAQLQAQRSYRRLAQEQPGRAPISRLKRLSGHEIGSIWDGELDEVDLLSAACTVVWRF